jgi:uncharacterized protein (DUF4415 family)
VNIHVLHVALTIQPSLATLNHSFSLKNTNLNTFAMPNFEPAAASDPDNPRLDDRMFARMRPATEVMPDILRREGGQRGPQKSKQVKTLVSLQLDPDVIRHFRRSGRGWQSRINEALRRVAKLSKSARS